MNTIFHQDHSAVQVQHEEDCGSTMEISLHGFLTTVGAACHDQLSRALDSSSGVCDQQSVGSSPCLDTSVLKLDT